MPTNQLIDELEAEKNRARCVLEFLQGIDECAPNKIDDLVLARNWVKGKIETIDENIIHIKNNTVIEKKRIQWIKILFGILAILSVFNMFWGNFHHSLVSGFCLFVIVALAICVIYRVDSRFTWTQIALASLVPIALLLLLYKTSIYQRLFSQHSDFATILGVIYAVSFAFLGEKFIRK